MTSFGSNHLNEKDPPPKPYSPKSLEELIDVENVLKYLVTGFRERNKTGVAICYYDTHGKLVREDSLKEGNEYYWHPLCKAFRKTSNGDEICKKYDLSCAEKLLRSSLRELDRPCAPLKLQDLAIRVEVYNKPIAVILTGQRLPIDHQSQEDIRRHISGNYPEDAEILNAILDRAIKSKRPNNKATKNNIIELKKALRDFSNVISEICTHNADERQNLQEQSFIEYWSNTLSNTRPMNHLRWTRELEHCLMNFILFAQPPFERIALFDGQKESNLLSGIPEKIVYHLSAVNSRNGWEGSQILFDLEQQREQKNLPPGSTPEWLQEGIGSKISSLKYISYFTFRQNGYHKDDDNYSMFVIQSSQPIPDDRVVFCRNFFEMIGQRNAVTKLFLRQKDLLEQFADQVRGVKHDIIMGITGITDAIPRAIRKYEETPESLDIIRETIQPSIINTSSIVLKLEAPRYEMASPKLENIDILELLKQEIEILQPKAKERSIVLSTYIQSGIQAVVLGERSDLVRIFINAIDNAIKYSFDGKEVIIIAETTQLRLGHENESVKIVFVNYGVGIPPKKLSIIKNPGVRGDVFDHRRYRTGSGQGLAIMRYYLEDIFNGALDIESYPADTGERDQNSKHLRWVTKVTCNIPATIMRQKETK